MIISEDLLIANGATYESYSANEIIFKEGTMPQFYFQVVNGTVGLINYHEDGKEFIQNILTNGQSFGESLLFNEKPYPMNAIALTDCVILKLAKKDFFNLLQQNPIVNLEMFKYISDRLYYKYIMLFLVSSSSPQTRLEAFLGYLKSSNLNSEPYSYLVPFTRQQLANLTGLRVETVIRTIKKMEALRLLKIKERKIYY
jgi:CRP-like cAMP-binding protein